MLTRTALRFELPDSLAAPEPPEVRGLSRDEVRLMRVDRQTGAISHDTFRHLPDHLRAGDCLVLNASRTLPASLEATAGQLGARLLVRLARRLDARTFSALLLDAGDNPWETDAGGLVLDMGGGLTARVEGRDQSNPRLWRLQFASEGADLMEAVTRLGSPVRYWYAGSQWDIDYYQTVYAREPGSMEMPSAGRAFTWRLLQELRRRRVELAFIVLHAGLSSYMDPEVDAQHLVSEEPYSISPEAAAAVNAAKRAGGRVVAVGTTVVRALESAVDDAGQVAAKDGSTQLHIGSNHTLRVVDGLLTGFHEPASSHLEMLSAFLPEEWLKASYDAALAERYLWHEFGDLNLILQGAQHSAGGAAAAGE